MKTLEQAARMALEALEKHGCAWIRHEKQYSDAITALREALDQPAPLCLRVERCD